MNDLSNKVVELIRERVSTAAVTFFNTTCALKRINPDIMAKTDLDILASELERKFTIFINSEIAKEVSTKIRRL